MIKPPQRPFIAEFAHRSEFETTSLTHKTAGKPTFSPLQIAAENVWPEGHRSSDSNWVRTLSGRRTERQRICREVYGNNNTQYGKRVVRWHDAYNGMFHQWLRYNIRVLHVGAGKADVQLTIDQ